MQLKFSVLVFVLVLVLAISSLAAGFNRLSYPLWVKDEMGNRIKQLNPPRRIICLYAPVTDLLLKMGLKKQIAAVGDDSIVPADITEKIKLSPLEIEKIKSLNPDLVFLLPNMYKNHETFFKNSKLNCFVIKPINSLDRQFAVISLLGRATNRQNSGYALKQRIKRQNEWKRTNLVKEKKGIYNK